MRGCYAARSGAACSHALIPSALGRKVVHSYGAFTANCHVLAFFIGAFYEIPPRFVPWFAGSVARLGRPAHVGQ